MRNAVKITTINAPNEPAYALLAQLHRRAFEPQGDSIWSASAFRQFVESSIITAQILQNGNLPVGFSLYRTVANEVEIISIGMDPEFQGKGFANTLISHLITSARADGAEKIFLEVRKDNAAAIHLYQKFAFISVGVRENYYKNSLGNDIDALVFSLELTSKD